MFTFHPHSIHIYSQFVHKSTSAAYYTLFIQFVYYLAMRHKYLNNRFISVNNRNKIVTDRLCNFAKRSRQIADQKSGKTADLGGFPFLAVCTRRASVSVTNT